MGKHIFLIYSDLGLGGVQRKITDIINSWKTENQQKNILHVIIRFKTQFTFEKQFLDKNSIIHLSPFQKKSLYCIFVVYLFIRYRPISVLAFFHQSLLYTLIGKILSLSKNTVIILSQDNILSMENRHPYIERPYPKWLIHLLCMFPRHIIVQTKYAKENLIKTYNIKRKKIVIIPNWFIGATPIYNNKPIDCMYCGRFAKQKRLDRLIQVFSEVKKTLPKFHALLIGEGEKKDMLHRSIYINNLQKNVRILPPTHNVRQYIAKSKLFILTSEFEGHPMVLLEAMASETVPIVIDYPGVHEYVRNQKTGYIEKDTTAMTNRILFLLNNEKIRTVVGDLAKKEVETKYNKNLITKTLSYL